MSRIFKVGVKYCGGCKSQFNRRSLVEKVKRRIGQQSVQFTGFDESELDLLFLVSGCPTGCVTDFKKTEHPVRVELAGKLFKFKQYEWEELIASVSQEIESCLFIDEKTVV